MKQKLQLKINNKNNNVEKFDTITTLAVKLQRYAMVSSYDRNSINFPAICSCALGNTWHNATTKFIPPNSKNSVNIISTMYVHYKQLASCIDWLDLHDGRCPQNVR